MTTVGYPSKASVHALSGRSSRMSIGIRFLAALAMVACSCSSIKVDTDYNPNVDFASLRSFAWLPSAGEKTGDPRIDNPLLAGRIERAAEEALMAKGFSKVDEDKADFFVNYHVGVDTKVDVTSVPTMYGYGRWGGVYVSETRVDQYEQGTLLIDVIDRDRHDLLWRGSGQARIQENGSPQQREERVRKAVIAILADFPPQ